MRRSVISRWILGWLAMATLVAGCMDSVADRRRKDPKTGSESHFLEACEATRDCAQGLACHCGICTTSCRRETTCSERGSARCAELEELDQACRSTVGWAEGICAASCVTNGDCGGRMICSETGWCRRSDPPTAGSDAGQSSDADRPQEDDANGSDVEMQDGTSSDYPFAADWKEVDAPPGGVAKLLRVDETIYAFGAFGGFSDERLIARSTDGGASWQAPREAGLDAILAESGDVNAVETSDGWYVRSGETLYRQTTAGAWREVATGVPTPAGTLGDRGRIHAVGEGLVMVAYDDSDQKSLVTSDDRGETWTWHQDGLAESVLEATTWNGRIYGTGYGGLVVSEDGGESWRRAEVQGDSTGFGNWIDLGNRVAGVDSGGEQPNPWQVTRSTDGVSWQSADLSKSLGDYADPVAEVDGRLVGITQDGMVGEIGLDGSWTPLGGKQLEINREWENPMGVEGGLLIFDWMELWRWTPSTGLQVAEVGGYTSRMDITGQGELWANGPSASLFRWTNEQWKWVGRPSARNEYRSFFAADKAYYADGTNCVYERQEGEWEMQMQWRADGLYETCDSEATTDGYISAIESVGGRTYLAKTHSTYNESGSTGLLELVSREHPVDGEVPRIEEMVSDGDKVWVATEHEIYALVDGQLRDRTPDFLPEPPPEDFSTIRELSGGGGEMFARVDPGRDAEPRLVHAIESGWKDVSFPAGASHPVRLEVTKKGVWFVAGENTWYRRFSSDQWRRMGKQLPEGAEVSALAASSEAAYVLIDEFELWELDD